MPEEPPNSSDKESQESTAVEGEKMLDDADRAKLELEEDAETEKDSYDVSIYGGDFDIAGLVRRFNSEEFYKPHYQREYVWTRKQASRFIQSILIGLPTPNMFLYVEAADNKSHIIDGLQRLTTLDAFVNGYWPSNNETKVKFRLRYIPAQSRFYNASYQDLDPADRRKFDNSFIRVMLIRQNDPTDNHSAAFHIFERLNSGGTPLRAQEMRNALFGGSFRDFLFCQSNHNEIWKKMTSFTSQKRGRGQELILRFLALKYEPNYKKPMKIFLNDFMSKNQNADVSIREEFKHLLTKTLVRIDEAVGNRAFLLDHHNKTIFSAPIYDSFMVAVANNSEASDLSIKHAHTKLLKEGDKEYSRLISSATTDEKVIVERIRLVEQTIHEY